MLKNILKNNIILTFFIGIIVFSIIYLFSFLLINIDKSLSDKLYSQFIAENIKVSDNIKIIGIDEKTIKKLGRFPFSRDKYIKIIENLNNAKVAVIGFDIIFADKSEKIIDINFAKAIKNSGNIVLGGGTIEKKINDIKDKTINDYLEELNKFSEFNNIKKILLTFQKSLNRYKESINNVSISEKDFLNEIKIFNNILKFYKEETKDFNLKLRDKNNKIYEKYIILNKKYNKVNTSLNGLNLLPILEKPLNIFEKSAKSYGYFSPIYNKDNNKVYSIKASKKFKNGKFNHFSLEILKEYYNIKEIKEDKKGIYINNKKIPKNDNGNININFIPLKKGINKFKQYSFIDIFNNNFTIKDFENKIIIIGATANGIKDIFKSPEGQKFGVYTHAELINTILTKQYKIYFPKNIEYLLIFLLILLSVYFNLSQRGKQLIYNNIAIISIFLVIILFVLIGLNYYLNFPAQFLFALILSLTVSNILKSYLEDKNKTLLNKALSQYVSKDIAKEILTGEGKVKLDGERKNISIFFSDIEGFTSISEKMNPEELVIFLREYLGAMSNIIMDEKGFIDKYEGDAIMALWGVFGYENSSTYDNCKSALLQQQKLKILNQDWKERFGEELKIRMGINTGEAIVGNIGATGRKMEFTALGDSVNLASRLEEVNKKYGTYLCVSQVVFEEQKDNFNFRYLDQIKVKGKNIPVKIYELISFKGEISDLQNKIITDFEKAIKLYLNRDFKKALVIFEELFLLGDNPSKTYISRCEIFIKNPPEENWDGVWTMKTK